MTTIDNPIDVAGPAITCHDVDVLDGMAVEYVSVPDVSDESHYRAAKAATQREIALLNEALRAHPELAAPVMDGQVLCPNNPVAAWVYNAKPALRTWRTDLVPSAKALTPLYNAEDWTLPTGQEIDPKTRNYFLHSLDAIAIRARAAIMSAIAAGYLAPRGTTRWASLACGAAIPVFRTLESQASGHVDVTLIDLDADALAHAAELASRKGFHEDTDFRLLQRHLIRDLVATSRLVDELGAESMDFVDMLGIFEYIPDEFNGFKSAAAFLQNAFRLVKPGGALVAANMLDTHPLLDFNQRGVGWPQIYPRSQAEILRVIANAGIPAEQVTMTIPDDGIYAVVEIRKPAEAVQEAA